MRVSLRLGCAIALACVGGPGIAWAQAAEPACEDGKAWVQGERKGACCYPGQRFDEQDASCAGAPTSCPGELLIGQGDCITSPAVVVVPSGPYVIGSPKTEVGRDNWEVVASGEIDTELLMMETEVTQGLYEGLMGDNPTALCGGKIGPDLPVTCVSWADAVIFANRLSEASGLTAAYGVEGHTVQWDETANGYRLPTDVEWEYTARAKSPTEYSGADLAERVAWYRGNSGGTLHQVASLSPNGFGVYDLSGNASEWVWDAWSSKLRKLPGQRNDVGPERLTRGGSFWSPEEDLRVASMRPLGASITDRTVGFRLVRRP